MKRIRTAKTTRVNIVYLTYLRKFLNLWLASWQRDITWDSKTIEKMINELLEIAELTDRSGVVSDLLTIMVFVKENRLFIADGGSRTMALNLIIRVFNAIVSERNLSVALIPELDIRFERESDNKKYQTFIHQHKGKPYSDLYEYLYDTITDWVDEGNDIAALGDVITNNIEVTVEEYADEELAMRTFVQINTGGKQLTKNEIAASLIEFYKSIYNIDIPYIESELEPAITSYYYLNKPSDKITLDENMLSNFMAEYVGYSSKTLSTFRKYMLALEKFKNTNPWYDILVSLDRGKTKKVVYVLIGKGYNLEDPEVEEFLNMLFVTAIVSASAKWNSGGTASGYYVDLLSKIGSNKPIAEIIEEYSNWLSKNYALNKISLNDFSVGLDNLGESVHKAILLFTFNYYNRSARLCYDKVHLEHSFPEKPSKAWFVAGWPSTSAEIKQLSRCLGNQFILAKHYNEEIGREFLDTKAPIYEEYFAVNKSFVGTPNYFDGYAYKEKKSAYAIERRDAYASFLANLPAGKILVK